MCAVVNLSSAQGWGGGWGSENGSKDEGLIRQISHSIGLFIPPYKELQDKGQPTYLVL